MAVVIFVLTLVLAFENIWLIQQYYVLFWTMNASTTIIVLLASVLGFLVGFFTMLYSFEIRKEREMAEEEDSIGVSPAPLEEPSSSDEEKKEEPTPPVPDTFDEDDEVLG